MYINIQAIPSSYINILYLKNKHIIEFFKIFGLLKFCILKIFWMRTLCNVRINMQFFLFIFYFFKKSTFFQLASLVDIVVVDLLVTPRFLLNYLLLSHVFGNRLWVSVYSSEFVLIPSLTVLYGSSNWLEREAWDMFGLFFFSHPDLRRLLTDYGFSGHPLRKDFPLSGYVEVFYDDVKQKIIFLPIALSQEYRDFHFSNPWLIKTNKSL